MLAEAQIVRAADVVTKVKLTLFGRTIVRLMETHMSDRTLCLKKAYEEIECFKEDGGNLSDLPRAILARHELALNMMRIEPLEIERTIRLSQGSEIVQERRVLKVSIISALIRYVRTAKLNGNSVQPKCRLIFLGHLDRQLGTCRTDGPTTSWDAGQIGVSVTLNMSF